MRCLWNGQVLRLEHSVFEQFPAAEQADLHGSNNVFLNTLAKLAIDVRYTDHIYAAFEPLTTELCSRWMSTLSFDSALRTVAALARFLRFSLGHTIYAEEIACRRREGTFAALFVDETTALVDLAEDTCQLLLVTILRLVEYDAKTFECLVPLPKMQVLLSEGSAGTKYLAAKLICLRLRVSEASLDAVVQNALGDEVPKGQMDGRLVDLRFWSLWEEKRLRRLQRLLHSECEKRAAVADDPAIKAEDIRHLYRTDLTDRTACFAGQLIPRTESTKFPDSTIVMTPTAEANVREVAAAMSSAKPVLLTGRPGCGKTTIVTDIARRLDKLSDMLVLHLNDQTDAKLLVGLYVSGSTPGSFEWQPGVLTTAVREGRWVFIEDLDRAPSEITSLLLPLLERNELLVPNLGGWIHAEKSFRLIASTRSAVNSRGEEVGISDRMLGYRHWHKVTLKGNSEDDLREIVRSKYPSLQRFEDGIMKMYAEIQNQSVAKGSSISASQQTVGIRELLRFCSRLSMQVLAHGVRREASSVPAKFYDDFFLEAIDCFAGACESTDARDQIVAIIAPECHFSNDRVTHFLSEYQPKFADQHDSSMVQFGRVRLQKRDRRGDTQRKPRSYFAKTPQALRQVESIAVAAKMNEPCLLVGETGVGKTAVVQEVASSLDVPLTVVNLSQQSEVNDLLGGFKPLNTRALAMPIKEAFEDLFDQTFSSMKNDSFMKSLDKAFRAENWSKVLAHFREALKLVDSFFKKNDRKTQEAASKRRKVAQNLDQLKQNWEDFFARLGIFEKHVSSRNGGIVFSFVEGNLVKAVRSGGWVLLDEINLASPDTLECIADLLSHGTDEAPFLLLSETGNIQKIIAHPNFRLFGAMNPATDIGKRDLPPSIRSRFTELFVHSPDQDKKSLLHIVMVYLQDYLGSDKAAPDAAAELFLDIRKLERENQLVDGASQKPHFTLRTLTRCLTFACDLGPLYGIRRALFEGFSMCFLTVLNAESKNLVSKLIEKHLLAKFKNRGSILNRLPKQPEDGRSYVEFQRYWLRQGAVVPHEPEQYIRTPYVEENLLNLVRATLNRRYPVLLQGPTSSGKTSMVEYLAARSGNKFVRINNHEHTDLQEYLGTYVSTANGLVYQEGVLVQALRQGHWIVLDELNLAPTDVLEALNRLLDDNRELWVPETQEVIRPHEDFMLFATQNPPGMYGGRKVLSRAFRNRFVELHFDDIPENELEEILTKRCPQTAPSFCKRIVEVYKRLAILRQSDRLFEQKYSFATLRDLFRWALRNADDRKQLAADGFMLLAERVRDERERQVVKRVIEEVMKESIDIDSLYGTRGFHETFEGIVWTKSARRLATLVQSALKHNEPVLLIGDTGCGKTSICQTLADRKRTRLNIVNAHQNTETGDLIGAQRPLRNRPAIEDQLRSCLEKLFHVLHVDQPFERGSVYEMLKQYDALSEGMVEKAPVELCDTIESLRTASKILFEWSDGSLVQAMKSGEYYLLDEISLADDSVLERLNSVLEPARSILLAEKGSIDTYVSAADGFQFLATMNPGGDYGKKELSPALRNRFTEIWVPPLSQEDDILPILEAKLKQPYRFHARAMLAFGQWFTDTFHSGQSSLSIRDMLAWTQLLNASGHADPNFALVHGAAMVYIDSLGATPSSGYLASQNSIAQQRAVCVRKLKTLANCGTEQPYGLPSPVSAEHAQLSIGSFSISRTGDAAMDPGFSFQADTTRSNASRILRALQLSKPILLEGSPGVGKTTLVAALADAVGVPLTRINLSDQTDLMDLFGSDVPLEGGEAGQFGWRDAPFLQAMQQGSWALLDEMNLASQSVLEGLNACLDHRGTVFVPELGRSFSKHPSFTLFAAQNPHHQGGGRKGLPASFVNRFTVVYADTLTDEDLATISSELFPNVEQDEVRRAVHYVSRLQELATSSKAPFEGGPWEFNLRDLLRWLSLIRTKSGLASKASLSDYQHLLFKNRVRNTRDLERVKILGDALDLSTSHRHVHFRNYGKSWYQCGFSLLDRSPLISNCQHLPPPVSADLVESAMICVQQNWPILLVGASESGKSSLVYHMASSIGAEVMVLPLSADTDAYDLIGGYEQMDHQRKVLSLMSKTKRRFRSLTPAAISKDALSSGMGRIFQLLRTEITDVSLEELAVALVLLQELYPESDLEDLVAECVSLKNQEGRDNRARFEWVDGVLVRALEEGLWLILDNANLCSSSVLDRLNALMEPNGSLTIHEHRHLDGSSRVVRPHPNFRIFLTMDPRYGELSRAMRNRCVELYLSSQSQPQSTWTCPGPEAALFRFRAFYAFDWMSLGQLESLELARVCFENLSFTDMSYLQTCLAELSKDGYPLPQDTHGNIQSMLKAFASFTSLDAKAHRQVKSLIERLVTSSPIQTVDHKEFVDFQPLHPLVNAPLLNEPQTEIETRGYRWLSQSLESNIDLRMMLVQLFDIREAQEDELPNLGTKTPLQRSLLSSMDRRLAKESTQPLATFFDETLGFMLDWTEQSVTLALPAQEEIIMQGIVEILQDVFRLADAADFNAGTFQAYLAKAGSLGEQALQHTAIQIVGQTLTAQLRVFDSGWKLDSGGSIDMLWDRLRPTVAANVTQLALLRSCADLADRFDQIMWTSRTSLRHLIEIRQSFRKAFQDLAMSHSNHNLQDIQRILSSEEHEELPYDKPQLPHFVMVFEGIRQFAYLGADYSTTQFPALDVAAARKTKEILQIPCPSLASNILQGLAARTGITTEKCKLIAIRQTLPGDILASLASVSEITLGSLRLGREELDFLGQGVAQLMHQLNTSGLLQINQTLAFLHKELYLAHRADAKELRNPRYDQAMQSLMAMLGTVGREEHSTPYAQVSFDRMNFQMVSESYLVPSLESLLASLSNPDNAERLSSRAWIAFFTGLIRLFVPDKPYDPYLRTSTDSQRWSRRKSRLEAKVKALQIYQENLTGERASLRLELAQARLSSIGQQPPIPPVVRPHSSRLQTLQDEFSNVLRLVRGNIRGLSSQHSMPPEEIGSGEFLIGNVKTLSQNIARAIERLDGPFPEYEDLARPVIHMLYGLQIGLELSLTADENSPRSACTNERSFCMLGLNFDQFLKGTSDSVELSSTSFKAHSVFLKLLNLQAIAACSLQPKQIGSMHLSFEALFKSWQEQLRVAQRDYAKRSSLYRYAGAKEENEDDDQEQLEELFPEHNDMSGEEARIYTSPPTLDPRQQAIEVAKLLEDLAHQHDDDLSPLMLRVYMDSALGSAIKDSNSSNTRRKASQKVLPAVILKINEQRLKLMVKDTSTDIYNFYKDSNVIEAERLCALLWKSWNKFSSLKAVWPEHATIDDVLRTIKDILGIPHSEPVAFFLPKVERLHGFVYEWQSVASREYSTAPIYDELTSLLVEWRRLELSTWARMLDFEDEKCVEDARSWWFVAYELVIHSSISVGGDNDTARSHVEKMTTELHTFLSTTSYGLFSHRLGLLNTLSQYATMLSGLYPHMSSISGAISNIVNYFSRYKGKVKDLIKTGRDSLEKDMKETVLLASWKDVNIQALRESAKKSHLKLLKVIRKYRALLGQTVEGVVQADALFGNESTHFNPLMISSAEPSHNAAELCKDALPGWKDLAPRFRESQTTSTKLQKLGVVPEDVVNSSSYLHNFAQGVTEAAEVLTKETPSNLTEDNKDLVKHLKTRKRKLLADVLKELRFVGFQSNPDVETLKRQAETPNILSRCSTDHRVAAVDAHLFGILDHMDVIRKSVKNHSADLSAAETARSIGYLESMLTTILRQRNSIVSLLASLDDLAKASRGLQSVHSLQDGQRVQISEHTQRWLPSYQSKLAWLLSMMDAVQLILEKQKALGGVDSSSLSVKLSSQAQKIQTLQSKVNALLALPSGLSSNTHQDVFDTIREELESFSGCLTTLGEEVPQAKYLTQELLSWTRSDSPFYGFHMEPLEQGVQSGEPDTTITQLVSRMTKMLDSAFLQVQNINKLQAHLSTSSEKASWYMHDEKLQAQVYETLRVDKIASDLSQLMQSLRGCEPSQLKVILAFFSMQLPIYMEYENVLKSMINRSLESHLALCKVSHILSKLFKQIITKGFCTPPEQSSENGNSDKVEEGTGLGEGEGAEDISKDIQDNEDLSELAQEKGDDDNKNEIEDEKNAIDMAGEDMEGEAGEAGENDEDDQNSADGEDDKSVEDELGSVNAEQDDVVDEKLWDGKDDDEQNTMEADDAKGQKKDEMTAQQREAAEAKDDEEEIEEQGAEEREMVAPETQDKLDQHTKEEENLSLPENMDIDNGAEGEIDSDIEEMSDDDKLSQEAEDAEMDDADLDNDTSKLDEADQPQDTSKNEDEVEAEMDEAGSVADTEPDDKPIDDSTRLHERDEQAGDADEHDVEEAANEGVGLDRPQENQENQASGTRGEQRDDDGAEGEAPEAQAGGGTGEDKRDFTQPNAESKQDEDAATQPEDQPFKKLGDALERWHRLNQDVKQASEHTEEQNPEQDDTDVQDRDFEHVADDEAMADTQALAPATEDQTHALDKNALESEEKRDPVSLPDIQEPMVEDQEMEDALQSVAEDEDNEEQRDPVTSLSQDRNRSRHKQPAEDGHEADDELEDIDNELSIVQLNESDDAPLRTLDDARRLWSHCERVTQDFALTLTEQLRLILAPTQAAKMRGDFRTGKRLNLKRIIPYIASQYKRDKIWMRRTVPSKRTYQVMLAVDDSRSMSQGGAGRLALEALALLSRSLSLLEVGQLCIVSFGDDVRVAHPFTAPFAATGDAGPRAFQHFKFQQQKTDVKRLVARSLELFREARLSAPASSAQAGELWQLQLIISDGYCGPHDKILPLVRQAMEERVMLVFVVVDAMAAGPGDAPGEGKRQSILEITEPEWEEGTGRIVRMVRYIDHFPFGYYLIVQEVSDLPRVLATALRQWFAEVAGAG